LLLPELRARLNAIPAELRAGHVLGAPDSPEGRVRLLALAEAVELLAIDEHMPIVNLFRLRLKQLATARSGGRAPAPAPVPDVPARQGELIPDARLPERSWGPYARDKGGA
jgi:hypothetical protein